jgi:hypothetical protein
VFLCCFAAALTQKFALVHLLLLLHVTLLFALELWLLLHFIKGSCSSPAPAKASAAPACIIPWPSA